VNVCRFQRCLEGQAADCRWRPARRGRRPHRAPSGPWLSEPPLHTAATTASPRRREVRPVMGPLLMSKGVRCRDGHVPPESPDHTRSWASTLARKRSAPARSPTSSTCKNKGVGRTSGLYDEAARIQAGHLRHDGQDEVRRVRRVTSTTAFRTGRAPVARPPTLLGHSTRPRQRRSAPPTRGAPRSGFARPVAVEAVGIRDSRWCPRRARRRPSHRDVTPQCHPDDGEPGEHGQLQRPVLAGRTWPSLRVLRWGFTGHPRRVLLRDRGFAHKVFGSVVSETRKVVRQPVSKYKAEPDECRRGAAPSNFGNRWGSASSSEQLIMVRGPAPPRRSTSRVLLKVTAAFAVPTGHATGRGAGPILHLRVVQSRPPPQGWGIAVLLYIFQSFYFLIL
jgi:hypothetical protein